MNVLNLHNVNAEVRAFIYQQLADLEQFLPEGASVTITIDDKDKTNIMTTIHVATPFGEVEANEESSDVFQSLSKTKTILLDRLGEIQRATDDESDESSISLDNIHKFNIH